MALLPFSGPVLPVPVPISKGGTGSATQNFVDLSSTQAVGGAKTFTGGVYLSDPTYSNALGIRMTDGTTTGAFFPRYGNPFIMTIKPDITKSNQFDIFASGVTNFQFSGADALFANDGGAITFKTFNATKDIIFNPSSGAVLPYSNNAYNLGNSSTYWQYIYGSRHFFNSTAYIDGGSAGLMTLTGQLKFAAGTTGAGSAALGSNSPAVTNTAPYTWLQVTASDGSQLYVPAWK
jgi:hypothetical protein